MKDISEWKALSYTNFYFFKWTNSFWNPQDEYQFLLEKILAENKCG
jgi:hypothetical protein